MHTYNDRPCSDCGDLDGCHIQNKVKRHHELRTLNFMADGGCGDQECQVKFVPFGKTEAREAHYGQSFPRIVCLCGSTRFFEQFMKANYEETMQGNIVLSVGFYPHSQDQAHGEQVGCSDAAKTMLDELHKRKIDHADEILVLNVLQPWCPSCKTWCFELAGQCRGCAATVERRGYIGNSTRGEIEYAVRTGKKVRYLEPLPEDK